MCLDVIIKIVFEHLKTNTFKQRAIERTATIRPWDVGLAGAIGRGSKIVHHEEAAFVQGIIDNPHKFFVADIKMNQHARVNFLLGMNVATLEYVFGHNHVEALSYCLAQMQVRREVTIKKIEMAVWSCPCDNGSLNLAGVSRVRINGFQERVDFDPYNVRTKRCK